MSLQKNHVGPPRSRLRFFRTSRDRAVSPSVLSRKRPRASVPAVWRGASSVNSPVNSNALEGRASIAREVSGEGKRTKGSRRGHCLRERGREPGREFWERFVSEGGVFLSLYSWWVERDGRKSGKSRWKRRESERRERQSAQMEDLAE